MTVSAAQAIFSTSQAKAQPGRKARLLTNSDQAWLVSEQRDRYQAISYPAPPISARRIISDPGINSPLVLMHNGREVLVTGHLQATTRVPMHQCVP